MENLFQILTQFNTEGLFPMLGMLVDWLMGDGLYLGAICIVIPLVGRIVNIFKKIF